MGTREAVGLEDIAAVGGERTQGRAMTPTRALGSDLNLQPGAIFT